MYTLKQPGGVSFVLRARNEEKYIADALTSLESLRIPFEIVVILHCCTDKTQEIVEKMRDKGLPIVMIHFNKTLSRAGYENLATPAEHPRSLTNYYNYCFSLAKYRWNFKWDADFRASEKLLHFLNHKLDLRCELPLCYALPCRLGKSIINTEIYLFNCLTRYTKHVFWELPSFAPQYKQVALPECEIISIPPSILKSYWREEPWFVKEKDEDIIEKWQQIETITGKKEPMGAARASCPEFNLVWSSIQEKKKELEQQGIFFYQ